MSERREYELTQAQFDSLLEASQPMMAIALHCGSPPSSQEKANRAWDALGEQIGFVGATVEPSSKGKMFFTAEAKP